MPHDRKGNKLHPGDIVNIPCVVKGIDKHAEYVNIAVEFSEGRHPDGKKELYTLNARQVELVKATGHSDPDMDVTRALSDSGVLDKPPGFPELDESDSEDARG